MGTYRRSVGTHTYHSSGENALGGGHHSANGEQIGLALDLCVDSLDNLRLCDGEVTLDCKLNGLYLLWVNYYATY